MTTNVSREQLVQWYVTEGKTTYELAELVGCSPSSTQRLLRANGIAIRTAKECHPRATVKKQCPNHADPLCQKEFEAGGRNRPKKTQRFCSHHCRMTLENISPDGHGSNAPRPKKNRDTLHDEAWLRQKYETEKLSTLDIATILNCAAPSVWQAMRKFGIPIRTMRESKVGKKIHSRANADPATSVGRASLNGYRKRQELKAEMVAAYGGECACCGEKELDFLTVDHTNRDGAEHRREIGGQSKLYALLKSQGWPTDGFRCLCMNCNFATRFGKVCPHQRAREMTCQKPPN